jgi:hypothetical protein
MTIHTRKSLITAYLAVRSGPDGTYGGYLPEADAYNVALHQHHKQVLDGLERLFGLRLDLSGLTFDHKILFMLFSSTATSYLALRTPWSGYLEAGLLHRKLQATGATGDRVTVASERIHALTEELRREHLTILDALTKEFLDERASAEFTSADLLAIGVDDSPPDPSDFPDA